MWIATAVRSQCHCWKLMGLVMFHGGINHGVPEHSNNLRWWSCVKWWLNHVQSFVWSGKQDMYYISVRSMCWHFFHPLTGKAPRKRKPWQDEEVKAVEKHMKRFITSCIVPSKRDCEKCLRAEPAALNNRDWQMLKYYVYNRITAYKKKVQHS